MLRSIVRRLYLGLAREADETYDEDKQDGIDEEGNDHDNSPLVSATTSAVGCAAANMLSSRASFISLPLASGNGNTAGNAPKRPAFFKSKTTGNTRPSSSSSTTTTQPRLLRSISKFGTSSASLPLARLPLSAPPPTSSTSSAAASTADLLFEASSRVSASNDTSGLRALPRPSFSRRPATASPASTSTPPLTCCSKEVAEDPFARVCPAPPRPIPIRKRSSATRTTSGHVSRHSKRPSTAPGTLSNASDVHLKGPLFGTDFTAPDPFYERFGPLTVSETGVSPPFPPFGTLADPSVSPPAQGYSLSRLDTSVSSSFTSSMPTDSPTNGVSRNSNAPAVLSPWFTQASLASSPASSYFPSLSSSVSSSCSAFSNAPTFTTVDTIVTSTDDTGSRKIISTHTIANDLATSPSKSARSLAGSTSPEMQRKLRTLPSLKDQRSPIPKALLKASSSNVIIHPEYTSDSEDGMDARESEIGPLASDKAEKAAPEDSLAVPSAIVNQGRQAQTRFLKTDARRPAHHHSKFIEDLVENAFPASMSTPDLSLLGSPSSSIVGAADVPNGLGLGCVEVSRHPASMNKTSARAALSPAGLPVPRRAFTSPPQLAELFDDRKTSSDAFLPLVPFGSDTFASPLNLGTPNLCDKSLPPTPRSSAPATPSDIPIPRFSSTVACSTYANSPLAPSNSQITGLPFLELAGTTLGYACTPDSPNQVFGDEFQAMQSQGLERPKMGERKISLPMPLVRLGMQGRKRSANVFGSNR